MNRPISLILALTAGLLGGLLSHLVMSIPVHAQVSQGDGKGIRAQSFTLVDANNKVVATFKPAVQLPPGKKLDVVLFDQNGREIWRAGSGTSLRALDAR